ncbi:MAG: hypothetical protein EAZ54_14210, partial [Curvibacter sp.]
MSALLKAPAQSISAAERDLQPQRVRHPLRFRMLEVVAVDRISPFLTRVTLGGSELEGFVSSGFDDHVKLFFPDPDTGVFNLPEIGPEMAPDPLVARAQDPIDEPPPTQR